MFAVKKKKRGIYRRKIRILFQIISTSLIMEYLNFLIPIKLLNWVSKIQPDDLCKLPYHPPMVDYSASVIVHIQV